MPLPAVGIEKLLNDDCDELVPVKENNESVYIVQERQYQTKKNIHLLENGQFAQMEECQSASIMSL